MGPSCLKVPWRLFKTDIRAAESLISWLEKSRVLLKQDPCTRTQKERAHVREGGKTRWPVLQLTGLWTGELRPAAIQFSHLHHTQSTSTGRSVIAKSNSLTQWLILKGSSCFAPTGTWAPSPDLSHPSISVKCSTAQLVLQTLARTSSGYPPRVSNYRALRSNYEEWLPIFKYLWLALREQWHIGNRICFSTP